MKNLIGRKARHVGHPNAALWVKALTGLGVLVLTARLGFSAASKIAPDLEGVDPGSIADVIVQFSSPASPATHAKVFALRGRLKKELLLIKGAVYSIPVGALQYLALDPEVSYISPDRPLSAMLDLTASAVNATVAVGVQRALTHRRLRCLFRGHLLDYGFLGGVGHLARLGNVGGVGQLRFPERHVGRLGDLGGVGYRYVRRIQRDMGHERRLGNHDADGIGKCEYRNFGRELKCVWEG